MNQECLLKKRGECCCTCANEKELRRSGNPMGFVCILPVDMSSEKWVEFMDDEHGICECHVKAEEK